MGADVGRPRDGVSRGGAGAGNSGELLAGLGLAGWGGLGMATSAMGRAVLGGLVTQSPEAGRGNKYLHLCLASVLPSSLFFSPQIFIYLGLPVLSCGTQVF